MQKTGQGRAQMIFKFKFEFLENHVLEYRFKTHKIFNSIKINSINNIKTKAQIYRMEQIEGKC